jgi:hypothetical protein
VTIKLIHGPKANKEWPYHGILLPQKKEKRIRKELSKCQNGSFSITPVVVNNNNK